jgi:histone H3
MLGHHQKQNTMMMKMRKVMIVITRLEKDQNHVIVKVKAVPTMRPLLYPRQSTRETTRRENKKKEKREAPQKKKQEAKEKAARLALLAATNAVQTTTAAAAANTATAGGPNPALTNLPATNATAKRWSPNRLQVYHARKGAKRRPPGAGALAEIRHYQRVGGLLIQKLPFQQLCRAIMERIVYDTRKSKRQIPTRFQTSAIMALQEAGEAHLVGLFEDVNLLAIHCKTITILTRDLALTRQIYNEPRIGGAI